MATRTGPLSSRRAAFFVSLAFAADVAAATAAQQAAIELEFRPAPPRVDPEEVELTNAIERTKLEPTNSEAHYTLATYYWEKAFREFTSSEADKMKFVQQGLQAIDEAIKLNPNYFEALTYKNLLLRVKANLETDPARREALLREADALRDKAQEIRRTALPAGVNYGAGRHLPCEGSPFSCGTIIHILAAGHARQRLSQGRNLLPAGWRERSIQEEVNE